MAAGMGDVTIDGTEFGGEIMRGHFRVRASNVIFRQLRIRTGDPLNGDYNLASPILLTGTNNPVRNIVIDHVSLMWGTEMNLAIYNDVADVTVQNPIMAEGLQDTPRGMETKKGCTMSRAVYNVAVQRSAERSSAEPHHLLSQPALDVHVSQPTALQRRASRLGQQCHLQRCQLVDAWQPARPELRWLGGAFRA